MKKTKEIHQLKANNTYSHPVLHDILSSIMVQKKNASFVHATQIISAFRKVSVSLDLDRCDGREQQEAFGEATAVHFRSLRRMLMRR